MNTSLNKFAKMYDTYNQMLYVIAIEISPTQKQAEQILITTFIKAHQQNIEPNKYPSPCMSLIKLLIQTAHEQLNNNTGKTNFKLNKFENFPILHHLLCEQATLENHCTENKITKEQAGKKLREELNSIRNLMVSEVEPQNTTALSSQLAHPI